MGTILGDVFKKVVGGHNRDYAPEWLELANLPLQRPGLSPP